VDILIRKEDGTVEKTPSPGMTIVDLASYLHDKKIVVENMLRAICASFVSTPGILRNAMEYMLFSNGKKIRPILAIAAARPREGAPTTSSPASAPSR
jgi:geranylgeranyl pyrophosphate synthase